MVSTCTECTLFPACGAGGDCGGCWMKCVRRDGGGVPLFTCTECMKDGVLYHCTRVQNVLYLLAVVLVEVEGVLVGLIARQY